MVLCPLCSPELRSPRIAYETLVPGSPSNTPSKNVGSLDGLCGSGSYEGGMYISIIKRASRGTARSFGNTSGRLSLLMVKCSVPDSRDGCASFFIGAIVTGEGHMMRGACADGRLSS